MNRTITLELPDNLYIDLQRRSQQTRRSLEEELLTAVALDLPVLPLAETEAYGAYMEVIEFLSRGPSAREITQFRLSDAAQERVQFLLTKEQEEGLTETETNELNFYVDLGDFLGVLRARSLLHLQEDERSVSWSVKGSSS